MIYRFEGNKASATIQDGTMSRSYGGSLITEKDFKVPDGQIVDRYVAILKPSTSQKTDKSDECTVKIDVTKDGQVGTDCRVVTVACRC
jgi:hypothetical protein